ncbi:hypothetical protein V8C34DRAFT_281170 [Trichoderma compactum]
MSWHEFFLFITYNVLALNSVTSFGCEARSISRRRGIPHWARTQVLNGRCKFQLWFVDIVMLLCRYRVADIEAKFGYIIVELPCKASCSKSIRSIWYHRVLLLFYSDLAKVNNRMNKK